MIDALIMAGGQSARMRKTFGPTHKSLISIAGITLLERNVAQLLHYGFRRLHVAISCHEWKLREYIDDVVDPFVRSHSASLTCLEESKPRGTIGIAKSIPGDAPLLVVNVDNLTTLDLRQMCDFHITANADLTIATHDEPFQIPFGQLVIDSDDNIDGYLEKPVFPVPISSGLCVLGPAAKDTIDSDSRTDINQVFERLKSKQRRIKSFRHQALWVDVNDAEAVDRASLLVSSNPSLFDFPNFRPQSAPLG